MPIMSDAEESAARLDVIKFLRAGNVSRYKLDMALTALQALDRGEGCNTPAEEFLERILDRIPHGLTPEDVQSALMEFENDFKGVRDNCRYAHRYYPKLAAEVAEEARLAIA